MKKQTGIWIDSTKAIIVTLDGGKEHITEIQSDLENRVYHDKEGDKGSFFGNQHMDSQKTFDERRKHQTNAYLKDMQQMNFIFLGQLKLKPNWKRKSKKRNQSWEVN